MDHNVQKLFWVCQNKRAQFHMCYMLMEWHFLVRVMLKLFPTTSIALEQIHNFGTCAMEGLAVLVWEDFKILEVETVQKHIEECFYSLV